MFKFESYITPIILDHVAKYVKDFRPQDAQLSLWQGEVVLQNLNMRLDVLQKEMQLPFELLSGHIHELSILVPWTKIISEPIKVTINTIEFVLKMKDPKGKSPSPGEWTEAAKKQEDLQQDEGGLVNKIIKNIEINCHNIIFKLVVEDIVLSMNVQLLSFSSADENWSPAMVDFNPVNVLIRKLCKISDLTICLDKRNEAGQIEVCQEPVLYRCNLECRILDKYNVRTKAKCSTKRIGIFAQLLDINVSSLQFPMAMRLLEVLGTLGGDGKKESSPSAAPTSNENREELFVDAESDTSVDKSYFSWMWKALPNLDFEIFEDDDSAGTELQAHTRDIGFYIEHLNFTLKKAEFITDTTVGTTKRLRYTPIVRVSLGGMYMEKVSAEELGWSSVKSGLTTIIVEPLGPYFGEDLTTTALLECSSSFEIGNSFIDKSLFDKKCLIADKGWGVTNYEEYCNRITEEYLLFRTPVLAFDFVKYNITNDDDDDDGAAATSNFTSNKRVQYRILSSGVTFRYNQALLKVKQIINDYIESYDYPAYHAEGNVDKTGSLLKLHPPLMEDYDALMQSIPICSYKLKLTKVNVEIHTFNDPPIEEAGAKVLTQRRLPKQVKQTMKHCLLQLEQLDGYWTKPLDPIKLVHTACQLPRKSLPPALLEACYKSYTIDARNVFVALADASSKNLSKILIIPKISCDYSVLIQPKLWQTLEYVPIYKLQVNCEQFDLDFSKQELIIMNCMLRCIHHYRPELLWYICKQQSRQDTEKSLIRLHNEFTRLQIRSCKYKSCSIWNASIKSLLTEIIVPSRRSENKRYELLSTTSKLHNNQDKWLEVQIQNPLNTQVDTETGVKTVIAIWIQKFQISVDKHFLAFLNSPVENEIDFSSMESVTISQTSSNQLATASLVPSSAQSSSRQLVRNSSRNSITSADRGTRKISYPEETVHFSSDRDEKTTAGDVKSSASQSTEELTMNGLRFLQNLVTHIEMVQSELCFSEDLHFGSDSPQLSSEFTKIKLPHLLIKSPNANLIIRSDLENVVEVRAQGPRSTFTWSVTINNAAMQNHTPSGIDEILKPVQTNISIAVTHKTEKAPEPEPEQSARESDLPSKPTMATQSTGVDSLEEDSMDDISLPSHADKMVQISRSCDSISLENPSLQGVDSDITVDSVSGISIAESVATVVIEPKVEKVEKEKEVKQLLSKDVISVSLHADTTAIHFLFSIRKIRTLMCNLEVLSKVYNSLIPAARTSVNRNSNSNIEVVTAAEEHVVIKEFLDLETNSVSSSMTDSASSSSLSISLLLQLTATKIIFELKTNPQQTVITNKCLLELEDLLFTVDRHTDYIKYTGKIGQMILRSMDLDPDMADWKLNESVHVRMLPGRAKPLPILNIVVTSVSSKDFHARIGAKRKGDVNRRIWEICLDMEAVEIILDLEKFVEFMEPLCILWQTDDRCKQRKNNTPPPTPPHTTQIWSSSNLPMVHLESKGFVLYLPARSGKQQCTVGIIKSEDIKITPNLENPLQRNPIRADVFAKAAELGILHTPGSALEDRQYELTLQNISLASGDWKAILTRMRDDSNNFLRVNPAFDWNNKSRKSSLQFSELFSSFTFVSIFAPCILYENVLICGEVWEFNCASNFVAVINTYELNLANCVLIQLNRISKILEGLNSTSSTTSIQKDSFTFLSPTESSEKPEQASYSSCHSRSFLSCGSAQPQSSTEKRHSVLLDSSNASGSKINHSVAEARKTPMERQNSLENGSILSDPLSASGCSVYHSIDESVQRQTSLEKKRSLLSDPHSASGNGSGYHSIDSCTQRLNSSEKTRSLLSDPHSASGSSIYHTIDETNEQLNLTRNSDSGFCSSLSSNGRVRLSSSEKFRSVRSQSSDKFRSLTTSGSSLQTQDHRHDKQRGLINTPLQRKIPSTISLITGEFIIKIFNIDKNQQLSPLICITISQPSFMRTRTTNDVSTQITLFGLSVSVADSVTSVSPAPPPPPPPPPPTTTTRKSSPKPPSTIPFKSDAELFPHVVLSTRQGSLGPTGIPPPLFILKSHLSKKQLLEIHFDILKPIVCDLSEQNLEQLIKHYILINEILLENPCFEVRSKKPVIRGSKNKLLRLQLFNADRMYCKLDWLEIKFSDANTYNCSLICSDVKANIKFLSRPEKATAKLSVGNIEFITNGRVIMHPIGLRASADLVTEPWYSLPLISANVRFNVVQIDIGIGDLLKIRRAVDGYRRVSEQLFEKWEKFLRNRPAEKSERSVKREDLLPIKYPEVTNLQEERNANKNKRNQREEFYQDDLRAGAFQFVEMPTDSLLPLPYQIQIIKKNFGIICWRYPQPRQMCRIQISPVLMDASNPIHIKCRMEYFSETYEGFLHFCDFWLSDTSSKELELPERAICANIWRVVIMQSLVSVNGDCFDAGEEDEDIKSITSTKLHDKAQRSERKESDFILHPKLLVGCMRIDTSFKSKFVPKIQFLVHFNVLKINVLNQSAENAELPDFLQGYKLAPSIQISQTFLTLTAERINFFLSIPSAVNYTLSLDMTFSIKCIDYGFLNMVHLLEETTLQSYIHVDKENNCVLANIMHDKIRLNFGPSILHTLLSARRHWEELLNADDHSKPNIFITKFVIVNQTYSLVTFGQAGTTERIHLQPKQVYMYSFRTNSCNQELTFFIADNESHIKEASQPVPISLKFEGNVMLQNIRIGNKCIIIKSQKLSATQIYVLIKGQFEVISMVPHDFRLEIKHEGRHANMSTLEYPIEQMSRCTFFCSVLRDSNIIMRLKFNSAKGRGRSGDIPVRTNKCLPWLVKVPHQNNFISFWIRVLREDLPGFSDDYFEPQRVLITIWPIFELCSMLTSPITVRENTGTDRSFEVEPKGGCYLLNVPATHLTQHKILFNYKFPLDTKLKNEYMLSLKSINWNEFFWYDEQMWQIEYALQELPAAKRISWPFNDKEEMRLNRMSRAEATASVSYNCIPSRDFSCTLCLKLSPWGMFINSTGLIVNVCDIESNSRLAVESNGIEMMLAVSTAFMLEIRCGKSWASSLPIYFKETCHSATDKYYVALEDISSEIVILCSSEVVKFVLDLKIEEGRRLFILRSKYNVTNFTKINFSILPFALDHKESATRADIKQLDSLKRKKSISAVISTKNCIGQTLDSFFDLYARKSVRSSDNAFVSFVCLKLGDESELSIPIPLTMPFTRKCFSLQNGPDSIPLVVSLVEQNGIFYLNIFDDHSPAILLNNQTDIKLVVAQTSAAENTKVTVTTPEYDGKHFVWNQVVAPFSKCYYTPPEMYINFPDVESAKCNLTLALWKDNGKNFIHWSKPIRTDKTWEKYLHVPDHGDVKVIICDKHNIIRVSIYYISQQSEFSVKDLRSRLLTPLTPPQVPYQPPSLDLTSINSSASITTLFSVISEESMPKNKPSDTCIHFRSGNGELQSSKLHFKLRFFVKELNINLNTGCKDRDYVKTDVFALYVDDGMLAFEADSDRRQLNVLLANMQIDNQIFSSGNYDFPVVLCSQELYTRNPILPQLHFLDRVYEELRNTQPMVAIDIRFFDDELKVSSVECSISPIRAYIEDAYLNDLLDALVECVPSNCVYLPEQECERISLKPGQMLLPRKIAEQSICMAEPMKLQSFRIQPLRLLLSVHTSVRLYIALDHSPLSFSSYERRQVVSVPLRFGQSVGMHYLSGAIFGAGWVVGSLEILGSPSGLARSFSTGLRDFVSMPVKGLLRGPWGFIVGITQGSASLLRNVTAGTVNSMTKLASSVARNLDRLSLDQDHIDRTDALRRMRPQGFTEGFSQGITGLGISLLGAVGGIARHTLEARTPGQVVTGVGKGLVGAVTKPLGGAAELLALTGQGVLQSVGFNTMPQQRTKSAASTTIELSDYCIWKLLPETSATDQIVFYQEVTLKVQKQLRRAYVLLTTTAFAIVEAKWEKLCLMLPVEKVEVSADSTDKTFIKVRVISDKEAKVEVLSYTNQRIMTFIRSSFHSIPSLQSYSAISSNSQSELHNPSQAENSRNLDWAFYINEHLGEYLIEYVKILHKKH